MRHAHENVGLEEVVDQIDAQTHSGITRQLRKFTLPASEARSLMRLLAAEDVSAATVFPGYAGVVEALRERKWWHGYV